MVPSLFYGIKRNCCSGRLLFYQNSSPYPEVSAYPQKRQVPYYIDGLSYIPCLTASLLPRMNDVKRPEIRAFPAKSAILKKYRFSE